MKPPFKWFGSKRRVADEVWRRFGNVKAYVEPFFGSGAVLLARPEDHGIRREVVCDINCFVANFFRSMKYAPNEVYEHSLNHNNHVDLVAWRWWCMRRKDEVYRNMTDDPEWHDAKLAGKWVWCVRNSIGNAVFRDSKQNGMPYLTSTGKTKVEPMSKEYIMQLSQRLHSVAVVCGGWTQCLSDTVLGRNCGDVGIFFDPPYNDNQSDKSVYGLSDHSVAEDVIKWCLEPRNCNLKMAVCGYVGDSNDVLNNAGWSAFRWKNNGGYANQRKKGVNENKHNEIIYFSPACNSVEENENALLV